MTFSNKMLLCTVTHEMFKYLCRDKVKIWTGKYMWLVEDLEFDK
jgi:hypothetical protein